MLSPCGCSISMLVQGQQGWIWSPPSAALCMENKGYQKDCCPLPAAARYWVVGQSKVFGPALFFFLMLHFITWMYSSYLLLQDEKPCPGVFKHLILFWLDFSDGSMHLIHVWGAIYHLICQQQEMTIITRKYRLYHMLYYNLGTNLKFADKFEQILTFVMGNRDLKSTEAN